MKNVTCNKMISTRFRNKQSNRKSSTEKQSLKLLRLLLYNTSESYINNIPYNKES